MPNDTPTLDTTAALPSSTVTPVADAVVTARGVTLAYGPKVIQSDLSFDVRRGEIMVLMGGSGCGKSTVLRCLVGLLPPARGQVRYGDIDAYEAPAEQLAELHRRYGVMFQQGALWSSMTVGENVMLPMQEFTRLRRAEIELLARFKLALVGLDGSFDTEPSALSGGMRKRAAIARAMALDPQILYLDEPSAGLDPLASARLDELILGLRDSLGTTFVMVTHELDSIFAVADRGLFLDARTKTMIALDSPQALRDHGPADVQHFLRRGRQP